MAANQQDWQSWVEQFNAPQPAAALPGVNPGVNIAAPVASPYAYAPGVPELFDPNFGRGETIRTGAENAIGSGVGMGSFGQNQTNRLLDSERKANFLAGHQILEPYLQRDFQAGQAAADRAARLQQIAAEGAQALQRLQLSEAGQTARLSTEQAGALQRAVLAGNQALQQITLKEAGDTGRQRSQIQGNLANTLLSAGLSGAGGGTRGGGTTATGRITGEGGGGTYFMGDPNLSGVGVGPLYNNSRAALSAGDVPHWGDPAYARANAVSTPTGLGSSSIDALLRKYGLL